MIHLSVPAAAKGVTILFISTSRECLQQRPNLSYVYKKCTEQYSYILELLDLLTAIVCSQSPQLASGPTLKVPVACEHCMSGNLNDNHALSLPTKLYARTSNCLVLYETLRCPNATVQAKWCVAAACCIASTECRVESCMYSTMWLFRIEIALFSCKHTTSTKYLNLIVVQCHWQCCCEDIEFTVMAVPGFICG